MLFGTLTVCLPVWLSNLVRHLFNKSWVISLILKLNEISSKEIILISFTMKLVEVSWNELMKRSPVTFVDSNELCISFSKRFLDQFKKNVLWVLLTCNDILFKLSANVNTFWIYIFEDSNYVIRENMLQISNLLTNN